MKATDLEVRASIKQCERFMSCSNGKGGKG